MMTICVDFGGRPPVLFWQAAKGDGHTSEGVKSCLAKWCLENWVSNAMICNDLVKHIRDGWKSFGFIPNIQDIT
jgi:hypothetical protein